MAPPKNHAVGDPLIVVNLESIWFICCILKIHENNKRTHVLTLVAMVTISSWNPFNFSFQITKFAFLLDRFLKIKFIM